MSNKLPDVPNEITTPLPESTYPEKKPAHILHTEDPNRVEQATDSLVEEHINASALHEEFFELSNFLDSHDFEKFSFSTSPKTSSAGADLDPNGPIADVAKSLEEIDKHVANMKASLSDIEPPSKEIQARQELEQMDAILDELLGVPPEGPRTITDDMVKKHIEQSEAKAKAQYEEVLAEIGPQVSKSPEKMDADLQAITKQIDALIFEDSNKIESDPESKPVPEERGRSQSLPAQLRRKEGQRELIRGGSLGSKDQVSSDQIQQKVEHELVQTPKHASIKETCHTHRRELNENSVRLQLIDKTLGKLEKQTDKEMLISHKLQAAIETITGKKIPSALTLGRAREILMETKGTCETKKQNALGELLKNFSQLRGGYKLIMQGSKVKIAESSPLSIGRKLHSHESKKMLEFLTNSLDKSVLQSLSDCKKAGNKWATLVLENLPTEADIEDGNRLKTLLQNKITPQQEQIANLEKERTARLEKLQAAKQENATEEQKKQIDGLQTAVNEVDAQLGPLKKNCQANQELQTTLENRRFLRKMKYTTEDDVKLTEAIIAQGFQVENKALDAFTASSSKLANNAFLTPDEKEQILQNLAACSKKCSETIESARLQSNDAVLFGLIRWHELECKNREELKKTDVIEITDDTKIAPDKAATEVTRLMKSNTSGLMPDFVENLHKNFILKKLNAQLNTKLEKIKVDTQFFQEKLHIADPKDASKLSELYTSLMTAYGGKGGSTAQGAGYQVYLDVANEFLTLYDKYK